MAICITYIGNYTNSDVNDLQVIATNLLIAEGIKLGTITPDYSLFYPSGLVMGIEETNNLQRVIKDLPHYEPSIKDTNFKKLLGSSFNFVILAVPFTTRKKWSASNFVDILPRVKTRSQVLITDIPEYNTCEDFVSITKVSHLLFFDHPYFRNLAKKLLRASRIMTRKILNSKKSATISSQDGEQYLSEKDGTMKLKF